MKLKFLAIILALSASTVWAAKPEDNKSTSQQEQAKILKALQISGKWARPAFKGKNTAAFMVIKNTSDQDIYLTQAACCSKALAKKVELHTHVMEGNIARMRPVGPNGIKVPAKGQVELKRGGLHVMLIGLDKDVRLGRDLSLDLQFKASPTEAGGVWMRQTKFPVHSRGPEHKPQAK